MLLRANIRCSVISSGLWYCDLLKGMVDSRGVLPGVEQTICCYWTSPLFGFVLYTASPHVTVPGRISAAIPVL